MMFAPYVEEMVHLASDVTEFLGENSTTGATSVEEILHHVNFVPNIVNISECSQPDVLLQVALTAQVQKDVLGAQSRRSVMLLKMPNQNVYQRKLESRVRAVNTSC
jgi:hypothetical protein